MVISSHMLFGKTVAIIRSIDSNTDRNNFLLRSVDRFITIFVECEFWHRSDETATIKSICLLKGISIAQCVCLYS